MSVRPLDSDENLVASVVLCKGAVRFHAGVAFKPTDGSARVLHLAGHFSVEARSLARGPRWVEAVPALDPIEQEQVAAFCAAFESSVPEIAYGLQDRGYLREDGNGRWVYVAGPNGSGMTCASFVHKIFDWAGSPLVDEPTWKERLEDVDDHNKLIAYLESQAASTEHVDAVRGDIGCIRIRPEELAVSSTRVDRPCDFATCAAAGAILAQTVESLNGWGVSLG